MQIYKTNAPKNVKISALLFYCTIAYSKIISFSGFGWTRVQNMNPTLSTINVSPRDDNPDFGSLLC